MRRFILPPVLATVLALVAFCSSARAAITMDLAPTMDGDFARLIFRFSASEGLVGGFAGNMPGSVGFSGQLTQQLAYGVVATPTTDLEQADVHWLDSRFLLPNSSILSAVAPFETQSTLGGAFTPMVAYRAANMDLVELVVPVGGNVDYDFGISEAIGDMAETTMFSGRIDWKPNALGVLAPTLINHVVTPPTRPVVPPYVPPFVPPVNPGPGNPPGPLPPHNPAPPVPDPHLGGPVAMDAISTIVGDYARINLRFTASEGLIGGLGGLLDDNEVAFRGDLVQQQAFGTVPTPTMDLNSAADYLRDTQFAVNAGDIISAVTPFETSTELGGAFALLPPARNSQMELVQLVMPVGGQLDYNFAVSQAVGDLATTTNFVGKVEWQTNAAGELAPVFVAAPVPPPLPEQPLPPQPGPLPPTLPLPTPSDPLPVPGDPLPDPNPLPLPGDPLPTDPYPLPTDPFPLPTDPSLPSDPGGPMPLPFPANPDSPTGVPGDPGPNPSGPFDPGIDYETPGSPAPPELPPGSDWDSSPAPQPPADPPTGEDPVPGDSANDVVTLPGGPLIYPFPRDHLRTITLLPYDPVGWTPIDAPLIVPTEWLPGEGELVYIGIPLFRLIGDVEPVSLVTDLGYYLGSVAFDSFVTGTEVQVFGHAVQNGVVATSLTSYGGQVNFAGGGTVLLQDLGVPEPSAAVLLAMALAPLALKKLRRPAAV